MDFTSLLNSTGLVQGTGLKLVHPIARFLFFILLSWVAVCIFKYLLNRFVFKAESRHVRLVGIFVLIGLAVLGARLVLVEISSIFHFSVPLTLTRTIDSLIVIIFFAGLHNFIVGIINRLGERIRSPQFKEASFGVMRNMAEAIMWFLCLTVVLRIWGIEIGPLLTGLGIAGIAIGLALQTTLGDLFSGVAIAFDKEFKLGDVIEVGDVFGVVKEISARSIKVKTYSNDIVVLTNSRLSSSNLINHTALKPRRITILLRLAYGSDVKKVKKICMQSIEKVARELKKEQGKEIILSNPKPSIYMTDLAEYSINFRVFVWFPSFSEMFDAEERLKIEIYNALNRNKIRFAQQNLILPAK